MAEDLSEQPVQEQAQDRLILTELATLREDQNVYDQAPLRRIVAEVVGKLPELGINAACSAITHRVDQVENQKFTWQVGRQYPREDHSIKGQREALGAWLRKYERHKAGREIPREWGEIAFDSIYANLGQYPYITEYLNRLMYASRTYSFEGDRIVRSGNYSPEETYVRWISNRLKAEKSAVLLGIRDVFPQQLGGNVGAANRKIRVVLRK